MQVVEGLIHSDGMKFQQNHQVSDLVILKFILAFCQKCNPLNKKLIKQFNSGSPTILTILQFLKHLTLSRNLSPILYLLMFIQLLNCLI
jgi:hypothetical protein